ncbi:1,4-alpha-glucan branching enzyme [Rhodoplanes tepidamans]|nr:1,4-alpha-glucan branching enzyme [Rhodoplanes tepidamans]
MGANVFPGGSTFRTWAPRATAVHVSGPFNGWSRADEATRLVKDGQGFWTGFLPGVTDGTEYKFYVVGPTGREGFKRDPHARELSAPSWNCVVCDPARYPWHDLAFRAPPFEDLIIYQFHVGTFSALDAAGRDIRPGRVAKFLDVLDRVEYLADLGVTAVQPLPIVEYPTRFSLGYNGVDYFSPEFDYGVSDADLGRYLARANALLAARGHPPVAMQDVTGAANQLRLLVDILHVYGMAVILDVVYNHAGGDFGDESLYFFDRLDPGNQNDSLYFTDREWAGGLGFAYWNDGVRQFLIDNALSYLSEYHVDGFRYDEVSVIDNFGGWRFCQDLTGTVRFVKPSAVQIAEFWKDGKDWAVRPSAFGGAGFDLVWHDGMREAVRGAVGQAAGGRDAFVDLDRVAGALRPPPGFDGAWRAVQMLENHDGLLIDHAPHDQRPRVAKIAHWDDPRSWYARSRARVATGLLLTGPGVPMLFMGQEFLEDKMWSDSPDRSDLRIWWEGLATDRAMSDHLRFTRELIALRRRLAALRRGAMNVFHVHNGNRVIAFHRWIEGFGDDLVVVASFAETTHSGYRLGFPRGGLWREVFNSDVYDNWVNPIVAGNGSGVVAGGPPMHGLPASAEIVIPANGLVCFQPG